MPKNPEHYEPTREDYKKANEMMTPEEKELSQVRSETFEAGEKAGKKESEGGWHERSWQISSIPEWPREGEGHKEVFDSGDQLTPLRCLINVDSDGELLFFFSSSDEKDLNKKFEFIINGETHGIVTLSPRPDKIKSGFGMMRMDYDERRGIADKTKIPRLVFKLKRVE